MEECIFCKIANAEIPAEKVYEDDNFLAFLDISPINKGHTLVIPKKHSRNLLEITEDEEDRLMHITNVVARAVSLGTNADGINITTNINKAAGQAVFHTHIHIIPRFNDDGLRHWPGKEYGSDEERKHFLEKIRGALQHHDS